MVPDSRTNYFPAGMPMPMIDVDDGDWWRACAEHRLTVQQCASCHTLRFPPLPICPSCLSFSYDWRDVSGRATIFSYTIVYNVVEEALRDCGPYNVVVVELADAPGLRLVSNVVDATPADFEQGRVGVGAPVEVVWDEYSDVTVPRFRCSSNPAT